MRVTVNGRPVELGDGAVAAELVSEPRGTAVAVNGVVVSRDRLADTPLRDADVVEVVRAVQGG
ncbi:MAG: sulfur carrier protein ThiS [Nocardioides sp.]|uniref:sulfur carrier protein ThiS n=1 Tax=Nocardioides sp. TaxID=35761 RepID=UPI0039E54ECA